MENHLLIETTGSTNAALNQMLGGELQEGFILQTHFQSQGKGQGNNVWESEPGKNLLFSMVLFPDFLAPARQFLLSKAVALAVVELLNQKQPGFRVKWPNDIYFGDRKLAGILIETAIMGTKLAHAIVGMGINVNQQTFHQALNPVSLVQILGAEQKLEPLLGEVKIAILRHYKRLRLGYVQELNREYFSLLYRNKGLYKYRDNQGVFNATLQKVEDDGRLLLKTATGALRHYWMKEVEFVR